MVSGAQHKRALRVRVSRFEYRSSAPLNHLLRATEITGEPDESSKTCLSTGISSFLSKLARVPFPEQRRLVIEPRRWDNDYKIETKKNCLKKMHRGLDGGLLCYRVKRGAYDRKEFYASKFFGIPLRGLRVAWLRLHAGYALRTPPVSGHRSRNISVFISHERDPLPAGSFSLAKSVR